MREGVASVRVAVVVPVLGRQALTHALLGDLLRDRTSTDPACDVWVVDNGGDYEPLADERVVRPGHNLGWSGGTNAGLRAAGSGHHAYLLVNNDVRLSRHFVRGLVDAWLTTGAGLVGPCYDDHWGHQRLHVDGPAAGYVPRRRHWQVAFVDGTCMLVPAATVTRVGLLDDTHFEPYGWGSEIDYGLRVRRAGMPVVVTRAAFLRHATSSTATSHYGEGYGLQAQAHMLQALRERWGDGWWEEAGVDRATRNSRAPGRRERWSYTAATRLRAALHGRAGRPVP